MTLHLRYGVAGGQPDSLRVTFHLDGAPGRSYTIKPLPPRRPAPRLPMATRFVRNWLPNVRQGARTLRVEPARGPIDPKFRTEERRVFQPWRGKNQVDDADRARLSKLGDGRLGLRRYGLQKRTRRNCPHLRNAGAAVDRSSKGALINTEDAQVPKNTEPGFRHHTTRWEGDTWSSFDSGSTSKTYSGRWVVHCEECASRAVYASIHELAHRRDRGRRSEGAGEAVEIRPAPLDAG